MLTRRASRTRQVVYTYKEGIQWCIQVAEGLQRLHTGSPMIIHRDLKLDNILLAGASRVHGLGVLCRCQFALAVLALGLNRDRLLEH